ncbi:mandelate racemase/muconate lactonizing enzyme family protein [Streptomyces sp. SID8361]|uniref:mandelate racemase/muconate lactonizing enzyme family protein n=1 Tax=Streptomyces sp. MnatMP-M27 TaxID=1839768 RepID=UPI00081F28F3|nr:mandelate racemase/muconate lactonizing enzyme family protein [Streptomyces sp. MnatMP-M27]MYU15851.1 mandelate racemase/muconate lactonizing enzyme family protein [Streptomyces sp. SID8361]SCG10398.1 L-alanine-DL-glutamate epimerase [Streptomyces sp. MnatMP-M27]
MRIRDVRAIPVSVPTPPESQVSMGFGRSVKRDAVLVRIRTEDGITGWGESHHGRSPGTIAHLVNAALAPLVTGADAADVTGVNMVLHQAQLTGLGLGTAAAIAMSGIDIALWDIRAQAVGWPLYRLLGGARRAVDAYAGGVALGYQPRGDLIDEVATLRADGFRAVKLRIGDTPHDDLARVAAVREAHGPDLTILTDANTRYSVADALTVAPVLEEYGVAWLEEPLSRYDVHGYRQVAGASRVPLAAGENHYTRYEFAGLLDGGAVRVPQPDISKVGGLTEALKVAALASARRLSISPHTASTGINMAATVHFLAAQDNAGYFEADVSRNATLRTELTSQPYEWRPDGSVLPLDRPGIGVQIDEEFLAAHPLIDAPGFA